MNQIFYINDKSYTLCEKEYTIGDLNQLDLFVTSTDIILDQYIFRKESVARGQGGWSVRFGYLNFRYQNNIKVIKRCVHIETSYQFFIKTSKIFKVIPIKSLTIKAVDLSGIK